MSFYYTEESVSLHLFDGSDPNFGLLYQQDNGKDVNFMTTYKKVIPFGTQTGILIGWIKNQIGRNKIHVLRIVGHGDSGAFFLGKLHTRENALEWRALRDCFDSSGRIELHSCAVASDVRLHDDLHNPGNAPKRGRFSGRIDGPGVTFMYYLAWAVNARVVGSVDDHLVSPNRWSFHHRVTVSPNGAIDYPAGNPMRPD